MVGQFNIRLRSLIDQLNKSHLDAIFVYGNTYGAFGDILKNPHAYGNQKHESEFYGDRFFIIRICDRPDL